MDKRGVSACLFKIGLLTMVLTLTLLSSALFVSATIDTFTLNAPDNNTYTNDTTPNFSFTVIGTNENYNCTLVIDDIELGTNTSVSNDTSTTITSNVTLSETIHTWYINCTDPDATNSTDTYVITVDTTAPSVTAVTVSNILIKESDTLFYVYVDFSEIMNTTIDANITFEPLLSGPLSCNALWLNTTRTIYNCTITDTNAVAIGVNITINTAIDLSGNIVTENVTYGVFSIDQEAPTLSIDNPIEGEYYTDVNVSINFTVSGASNCWYSVDGGGSQDLPGCNDLLAEFTETSHTLIVFANDTVNNIINDTVSFTVDASAPVVDAVSVSDTLLTNMDSGFFFVYVNFSEIMNTTVDANITFNPNPTGVLNCTSVWINSATASLNCTITDLDLTQSGVDIIVNNAIDLAGNIVTENVSSAVFDIDQAEPTISIVSPSNVFYNITNITLEFDVTDGAGCWYSLDNAALVSILGCLNTSIAGLSDATHNLTLYVNDSSDNTANDTVSFTIDSTGPVINVTYPSDGSQVTLYNGAFNISVRTNENVSYMYALIDSDSMEYNFSYQWDLYNWTLELSGLSVGSHSYNITATDLYNNTVYTSTYSFIFPDVSIPALTLNGPDSGELYNTTGIFYFNFTVIDNVDPLNCSLFFDGTLNQTSSVSNNTEIILNITIGGDGTYLWYINCTDGYNLNVSEIRTFTIDGTAPEPTGINSTSHPIIVESNVSQTFNFTFYWSDVMNTTVNATINISGVSSNTLASCTFNWANSTKSEYLCNITDFNETSIDMDILVSGGVSNSGLSQSSTYTFTDISDLDMALPIASITYNSNQLLGNTSIPITLTGTLNDTGGIVSMQLYINGASVSAITNINSIDWNYTWSPVEGLYNLTVEACDIGQCANSTEITNISIDLTAPVTTNGTVPNNWNNTFNITLNASDVKSSIGFMSYKIGTLSWANGSNVNGISNILLTTSTNISSGNTNISYYSVDSLGNIETEKSIIVLFDKTAPASSIVGILQNGSNYNFDVWDNNTVLVNLSGDDDSQSGYNHTLYCVDTTNTCTPNETYTTTLEFNTTGINFIRYESLDNLGNVESINFRKILITNITTTIYMNESEIILDENITNIIVNDDSISTNISVPSNVNGTLDLNELFNSTVFNATIPGNISINASTTNGIIMVMIPENVTLEGNFSWTGIFNLPTAFPSNSVSITADSGKTVTSSSIRVIEIGSGNIELITDKAIRINFTGRANKYVGYYRNAFTKITTTCVDDNQTWADENLTASSNCKISIGNDLILWTKHFTKFVTYEQTTTPSGGGGGGGGGGGSVYIPPATTTDVKPESISFVYVDLLEGVKTIDITSSKIPVYQLLTNVIETSTGVEIKISELFTPIRMLNVTNSISIYKYFQIDTYNLKVSYARILFKVNKTWVAEQGDGEVYLSRYNNNVWEKLQIKKLKEDNVYFYYEALSPGFSQFAIATPNSNYVPEKTISNSETGNASVVDSGAVANTGANTGTSQQTIVGAAGSTDSVPRPTGSIEWEERTVPKNTTWIWVLALIVVIVVISVVFNVMRKGKVEDIKL